MTALHSRKAEPRVDVPGYRLIRELAAGSSARVFLAVQESLQREVAIKLLAPGLFDAEETRSRFLQEAKVQARLNHPAILSVLDAGFVGKHPFLVLEVVEGGSLRSWLARVGGKAPLVDGLRVSAEIAAGLEHAHSKGIIHRDLKPENVLMTGDGRAKLADFGLARQLSEAPRTAAGVVLGTPGYVAPEVLGGAVASTAADLYALGSILYELFTGRLAFDGNSIGETIRLQLSGPPARPGLVEPELPAMVDKLVMDCLDPEPGSRPTAAVAAKALEAARMSRTVSRPPAPRLSLRRPAATGSSAVATTVLGARPSSATVVSAARPAPGRARPWLFGGVAAMLALVALALRPALSPEPAPAPIASPAPDVPAKPDESRTTSRTPAGTGRPEETPAPPDSREKLRAIVKREAKRINELSKQIQLFALPGKVPRFQVPAAVARGLGGLLEAHMGATQAVLPQLAQLAQMGDRDAAICAGRLLGECAIAAKMARGRIWSTFHPGGLDPELLLANIAANAKTETAVSFLELGLAPVARRLADSLPAVPSLREHPACQAGMAALVSLQRTRKLGRQELSRLNDRVLALAGRAIPGIAVRGEPGRQNVAALRHVRTALDTMGSFELRRTLLEPARRAMAAPGPPLTPVEVLLRYELECDVIEQMAPTIEMSADPIAGMRRLLKDWYRQRDALARDWPYELLTAPPVSPGNPSVAAALSLHPEATARLREADQACRDFAARVGLSFQPLKAPRQD